jgi:hypothetical protein
LINLLIKLINLKQGNVMKKSILSLSIAALLFPVIASAANSSILFNKEWTYAHLTSGFTSEISAFDAATSSIWVAGVNGVDILDLATGASKGFINVSPFGSINSVAIHNGVAAFAIENSTRTENGFVQFYNTSSNSLIRQVSVGALPDMVTFTPDGTKLLVANEGTPDKYGEEVGVINGTKTFGPAANDPVGSVTIINTADYSKTTATFSGVPTSGSNLRANVGMDYEPEYIAINADGTKAFVNLQEHNGLAVLDINSSSFTEIIGLGAKDFSLPGNSIDPKDDGSVNFGSHNVKGLYQPDGIASFEKNGQTYLVMANEGDFREDDGDRAGRGTFTPNPADPDLNRIRLSNTDSSDGNLLTIGGRSFSIRDESGNIVYDSGDQLDKAAFAAGIYDDSRSDDKGVEPEGVTLLDLNGKKYAFIGLERTTTGAVAVYDITDPANSSFLDLIVTDGDISPEGIQAFVFGGKSYLSIANEVSNTTTLYSIAAVPEPETYAMLLAGLAMIGFATKRKKQA